MSTRKPDIKKITSEKNYKKLAKALSHDDEVVRRAAADALDAFIEPLISALGSEEENAREKAIDELVRIGSPALEQLTITLKYGNVLARSSAAIALGRIGDQGAEKALIKLLDDGNWVIRKEAVEALGAIGDGYTMKALAPMLKDGDSKVRVAAARALGRIGDKGAVKPLTAALNDPDKHVSKVVAEVLTKLE